MDEPTKPPWRALPGWFWLLWLAFVAAWTAALLVPIPGSPGGDSADLSSLKFLAGKTLHIGAYAVLVILASGLPVPRRWRWLLLVFASLHGLTTEYLQTFTETRTGKWEDVGIDHIGLALGPA